MSRDRQVSQGAWVESRWEGESGKELKWCIRMRLRLTLKRYVSKREPWLVLQKGSDGIQVSQLSITLDLLVTPPQPWICTASGFSSPPLFSFVLNLDHKPLDCGQ